MVLNNVLPGHTNINYKYELLTTGVQITQNKGKERENSYQKLKRSP